MPVGRIDTTSPAPSATPNSYGRRPGTAPSTTPSINGYGGWTPNPGGGNTGGTGGGGGSSPGVQQPPRTDVGTFQPPSHTYAPPRDWKADAQALYPWLPDPLLTIFAQQWAATGDPGLALAYMRQHPEYDRYFAGNRRDDGSFRYSEQEYLAVRGGMAELLADYQQNPDAYQDRITAAIAGDVSVQEFSDRLGLLWNEVFQQIPQIRSAYVAEFGLHDADPAVSDANIFASFLNPGTDLTELRINVSNAQIVGQASAYGFSRGWSRADELRRAGLSGDEARDLYQQAQVQTMTLSALASRYYDPDDTFGIDDFEDAVTGLDPLEQERAARLIQFERSAFSDRGDVVRDQVGALTGLRQ